MRRTLLLALPLVLVGILVTMLTQAPGDTVPGTGAVGKSAPADPMTEGFTGSEIPTSADEPASTPIAAGDRTPAPTAGQAIVTGRTVAAETGAPLEGVVLRLTARARDREDQDAAWENPERITTAADGIFELRFAPPTTYRFTLSATAADRARMSRTWEEMGPDTVDLGDIPMIAGAEVAGVVRDEEGNPAPAVRVRFSGGRRAGEPEGFSFTMSASAGATTADGSFRTPRTLLPGNWNVRITADDYQLVGPENITIPEDQGTVSLQVTVRSLLDQPTITGVVVDEAGAPVSGFELVTYIGTFPYFENRGRSGADGRFTIRKVEGGDGPVRLGQMTRRSYTLVPDDREYQWGAKDVRVVVQRPRSVRIAVVEAVTGRAVEDYAVRILPRDGTLSSSDGRNRTSGHHEGGMSVVEGIRMGPHVAVVLPEDKRFLASEFQEFELGEQGADLRFELQRSLSLTVQLVAADGAPVPGSQVQLLRQEGGEGELELDTLSGRPEEAYSRFSTSGPVGIILGDGVTDGDGTVILHGAPSAGGLAVKALGPGHIPLLHTGVSLREGSPVLILRVGAGATLTGTVTPARVLEFLGPGDRFLGRPTDNPRETYPTYYPAVLLKAPDRREQFPQGHREPVPIQEDGSFTLGGIPPGEWNLHLRYFVPLEKGGGSGGWDTQDLQALTLQDGETRSLDLDLSALVPGTISGQVFLDGEVYAGRELTLQRVESENASLVVQGSLSGLATDDRGRFAEDMLPGTYRVVLVPEDRGRYEYASISGTELVELRAGQSAEQVFRIEHRILRVRILESDGTPAVERYLYSSYRREEFRTDPEGWVVFDPAPLEPVTFSTWAKGRKREDVLEEVGRDFQQLRSRTITLGPVQMPQTQKEAELTLRLPPKRD